MNFENKTILITGASSGIGEQLAKDFAALRCNLILLARSIDKLEALKEQLLCNNISITCFKCDVSDKNEVAQVFSQILSNYSVDIAILNSGVSHRTVVPSIDSSKAEKTIQTNLLGMIYCFESLVPYFIKKKGGTIAGVSSLADGRGFPKSGVYCASKSAVTTYLESMRIELKAFNIKVITIRPGFVKTPMTNKNEFKMYFLMDAKKASKIIIKGLAKEKRMIDFPLRTSLSMKVIRLLPNFFFDYISTRTIPKRELK